ncbi:MAG: sugar-binding protein [Ruminococcus sp.]|nr:sugar-binding protein [Ruminococcus sp.]
MKKVIAALASLAMVGSLVSCGSGATVSETESAPEAKVSDTNKTIGIAMPTQDLVRWNSDGEYLKKQFESVGYNVILTYSDNDAAKQNNDILSLISEDVDLLLIAAVDGNEAAKNLDGAKEKNIPVVAYDRLIMNTDALTYYISFDNAAVGKLQGEFVKESLDLDNAPGHFNIEFVGGDSGDNNAKYFFSGAYDTLSDYIKSGKLIIKSGNDQFEKVATKDWASANAKENMESIIDAYYTDEQLSAVVCANDSTALGVSQAIASKYKGTNDIIITGQDGDLENLRNIVDGKQSMTVYKNLDDEATVAFEVCRQILDGGVPAASLVDTLSVDVTYDTGSYNNGKKYIQSYLLAPYVITKDNLQLLVETGLYKWDSNKKYLESSAS